MVNNFVLKALREKILVLYEHEYMRNYVHLHDVCRSFKFVIDNWDHCKNETYNIVWKKNDLCMINNKRFMHGRTKIESRDKKLRKNMFSWNKILRNFVFSILPEILEKKKPEREIIFECMSFIFFLRLNIVQNLSEDQIKEIFILNTRKYLN